MGLCYIVMLYMNTWCLLLKWLQRQPLTFQHCPLVVNKLWVGGHGNVWRTVLTWEWRLLGVESRWDADNHTLVLHLWCLQGTESGGTRPKMNVTQIYISLVIIIARHFFTPYGFIRTAAQHQHFIRLLMRWIERKDVLSSCSDLRRGQRQPLSIKNNIAGLVILTEMPWYLDPEPLGHNLDSPVWIKLFTDKLQVAWSVCDPGDNQTVWRWQKRNREPL